MQIKTKIVSYHIADSKLVKQEVNGTVILPPLVFLLRVIMLTVGILSVVLLSVVYSECRVFIVALSVVMLNAIMLNVVALIKHLPSYQSIK